MILRRVTIFSELAILRVVIWLSKNGPEAFESILRIGHGFVRNGVQQEFLSMSSKVSA